jgi:trehalose 6-phosphate synthase
MAGAAEELADCAVVVNPYDGDSVADGIHQALNMGLEERTERWTTGMSMLRSNTAEIWRERFLDRLLSRPAKTSSAAG